LLKGTRALSASEFLVKLPCRCRPASSNCVSSPAHGLAPSKRRHCTLTLVCLLLPSLRLQECRAFRSTRCLFRGEVAARRGSAENARIASLSSNCPRRGARLPSGLIAEAPQEALGIPEYGGDPIRGDLESLLRSRLCCYGVRLGRLRGGFLRGGCTSCQLI
jgi:hypothetical protein